MKWDWQHLETARFEMGSDRMQGKQADDEGPTRLVTVGSLFIAARCVSNSQFRSFVEATGHRTNAESEGTGFVISNHLPEGRWVSGVCWRDPFGDGATLLDDEPVVQVSWFDCQEFCRWSGTLLPSEAQWERAAIELGQGCLGKLGLRQWCEDFYHPTFHRGEQRVNPTGPIAGTKRVLRGGSPVVTERHSELPDLASNNIGFRVVRGRLWEGTPADESSK